MWLGAGDKIFLPQSCQDLSVLDGPEDVNLDVLFTGGGVLFVLSVMHRLFSFYEQIESLYLR